MFMVIKTDRPTCDVHILDINIAHPIMNYMFVFNYRVDNVIETSKCNLVKVF